MNTEQTELHNDLVATYNEVEEVLTDFEQLTDEELIEVKGTIINRLKMALQWLGKYVSDEDIITDLEATNVQFYLATYDANESDEQPYKEVIAVFVDNKTDIFLDCYANLGGHSTCSQGFLAEKCKKITDQEDYVELYNELLNLGYNLNIV